MNNTTNSLVIEQRKKQIKEIISQYEERITILLNGKEKEELTDGEKKTFDILVRASMFDPRRPDVGFGTREMLEKGFEISSRLDAMSENDFKTSTYVLEWLDFLGDGMKITNIPIDNF